MKANWPSGKVIVHYIFLSSIITALFAVVYFNANNFAANSNLYSYYLEIEKSIPFVPAFILIYFSLNLLMTAPILYLNVKEIYHYGIQIIIGTIIAGIFFVILPGELGFTRVLPEGVFRPIYEKLFEIDAPHNLAPSLHIFYTYITVFLLVNKTGNKIWHLWGVLMCLAVLLTHQHHLIDIVTGILLAFILSKIKVRSLVPDQQYNPHQN